MTSSPLPFRPKSGQCHCFRLSNPGLHSLSYLLLEASFLWTPQQRPECSPTSGPPAHSDLSRLFFKAPEWLFSSPEPLSKVQIPRLSIQSV